MAIPWNEDDPRDAALIVQNLTNLLRQIARRARLRQPPTVALAQDWHRQIYKGVRLPVPYYAGEVRDSDSNFPELYGPCSLSAPTLTVNGSGFTRSPTEMGGPLESGRTGAPCATACRRS